MKKTLLKILILLLSAILAVGLCAQRYSGTLTLYCEIPPEASAAEITFAPEGVLEAETVLYNFETGRCKLTLQALNLGETVLTLRWDRVDESGFYAQETEMPLHVLPGNVILDEVTLNFSGWRGIALLVELVMLALAGILFYEYLYETRHSGLYSYRRIRLLGFALFFLILALIRFSSVAELLADEDAGTVWSTLIGLFFSARQFAADTSPVVLIFAAGLFFSNIVLLKREGTGLHNFLGIGIAAVMAGGSVLGITLYYSRAVFPWSDTIINIYSGLFVYFECHFAATINCALQAALHIPAYDRDYILILGCRVRPDGTLYPLIRGRVDCALAFREKQLEKTGKAPVLVPSGGKGSDEQLSEAEAMAAYLRAKGIPAEEILVENRSTTTMENLLFSQKLINARLEGRTAEPENGQDTEPRIAFSTSNYHVFRGGILAGTMGWRLEGMGSKTVWYYWPNAFLREFIGLMAVSWVSQLVTVAIIVIVSILLTGLV